MQHNLYPFMKMVSWYDPGQLVRTGVEILIGTIFGSHANRHLIEALGAKPAVIYDYTRITSEPSVSSWMESSIPLIPAAETDAARDGQKGFWIDYVAALGDGWDSTYSVASSIVQPTLAVEGPAGHKHPTERAAILIFGGNQVFPVPSPTAYQDRLIAPYWTALRLTINRHPHIFAIPGNHDWSDNLVSFTRLFCAQRWFAGWRTRQSRSYFALRLPHGWWLLGADTQLGSDIDRAQVEYFREAAKYMEEDDRVILCIAEPYWIYAEHLQKYDPAYQENMLAFLEHEVLGRKVSVFLTGGLHHYCRYEATDGTQKITAGGGGAFLHPTHALAAPVIEEGRDEEQSMRRFMLRACFPAEPMSRQLSWRNLLFPLYNPTFGYLTAILYFLTGWTLLADIGPLGIDKIGLAVQTTLQQALASPVAMFWGGAMLCGFVLFTDTHSNTYRWVMGSAHGLMHIIAAFFLGWGATYLSVCTIGLAFKSISQLLLTGGLIFIGGYAVGPCLIGLYLLVSLNVFGRHANEAFSSLKIPDWKHFLRLHIDANGDLTIFPIGIRRVPRRWKQRSMGAPGPEFVPDDRRATAPELIEPPIVLKGSTKGQALSCSLEDSTVTGEGMLVTRGGTIVTWDVGRSSVLLFLIVLGVVAGLAPIMLFLGRPLGLIYLAVGACIVGGYSLFKLKTDTAAHSSFPEMLPVALGAIGSSANAGLVLLVLHQLIYWGLRLVAGVLGWFGLAVGVNALIVANFATLVFAVPFAASAILLAARGLTAQVYPTTAGVRSRYSVLLERYRRMLPVYVIMTALVPLGLWLFLAFEPDLVYITLQVSLAFILAPASISLRAMDTRRLSGDAVQAIGMLLEAVGYEVTAYPRTDDQEIDPFLANLDLFAHKEEQVLAVEVITQAQSSAPVDWADASSLYTAALALSNAREKLALEAKTVEPMLVLIGRDADESLWQFSEDKSVQIVSINDTALVDTILRTESQDELRELAERHLKRSSGGDERRSPATGNVPPEERGQ